MFYNKKGEWRYEIVVVVLLALVIGVILFIGVRKYAEAQTRAGELEICRLSVAAAAKLKVPGKGSLTSISCPVEKEVFKEEDKNEINEKITQLIDDCIYIGWEGKLDWTDSAYLGVTKNQLCIVCSIFSFTDKSRTNYDQDSFYEWVKINKMKSSNLTYLGYYNQLTNKVHLESSKIPGQTSLSSLGIDINQNNPINPAEPYVIYFSHTRDSYLKKIFRFIASIELGQVIPIFHFKGSSVSLKPIKDMAEECSLILNIKDINIEGKSEEEIKRSLGLT